MPTLQFAPVLRTPVANGLTLSLDSGLAFAPVLRRPYVPGLLLLNEIDEPMTVEVVYGSDPNTVVATIDQTEPRSWDFQELRSETGAASLTLPMNDPLLSVFDTDDDVLLRFYYAGLLMFLALVESDDELEIAAPDDESGEDVTYTCRGAGALMEGGTVDPVGGPYRSPVQEDRHLGWGDRTFDHSGWATVTVQGDIQTIINVIAFELSVDPAEVEDKVRQDLPFIGLIPVLGPPGSTSYTDAPVGDWYVYEDETTNPNLNIATAGDYIIYFGPIDDELVSYVDGQQVVSTSGPNAFGVVSAAVTLTAGPHSVASRIRNLDIGASPNPTHYSWQITTEARSATFIDPGAEATLIAFSNGSAKVLAYPAATPGQPITKTIRILLDEIQTRGYLAMIGLDFDDNTFTDGRPAPPIPDVATKVGNSLLGALSEWAQTYIEWRIDPATLNLQVWEKGTRTADRTASVSFHEATDPYDTSTGNLIRLTRKRERRKVGRLLLRWHGGWAHRYSFDGEGMEQALEIGSPPDINEVYRIADGQLDVFGRRRYQRNATIAPRDASEAPGTGFLIGDQVLVRGDAEFVLGWQIATNDETPEDPDVTLVLNDLLLSPEERLAIEVRKIT